MIVIFSTKDTVPLSFPASLKLMIVEFSTKVFFPDGKVTYQSHYGNEITTYETLWGCGYPEFGDLRFLGLGGFARVERMNNGVVDGRAAMKIMDNVRFIFM